MRTTDCVVVGGGIIGSVIARELIAKNNSLDVVMVERSLVGHGASLYSAGVHFPRGASPRVLAMSEFSQRYYEHLSSVMNVPIYPLPMSLVCDSEHERDVHGRYSLNARLRPSQGVGSLCDELLIQPGQGIVSAQGCNYADVRGLTTALIADLRDKLVVEEGTEVVGLEKAGNHIITLGTGEKIAADKVILAPGPWVRESVWRNRLEPLRLRVKKIVAVHIDIVPRDNDELIVFHEDDAFLLPCHKRGHWLFSYTCNEWDVDPATMSRSMIGKDVDEAKSILAKYSNSLPDRIKGGRVFCDTYSENREPVISTLDDADLIFAGGANGSGYRLAPAIAAAVIALI